MIPEFLKNEAPLCLQMKGRGSLKLIDKTLSGVNHLMLQSRSNWQTALQDGFLQQVDARLKVVALVGTILLISILPGLTGQLWIAFFIGCGLWSSKINLPVFYRPVLMTAFFLGMVLFFPIALNIFMPGTVWIPLFHLSGKISLPGGFHLPEVIGFSREGIGLMVVLFFRLMNSLALVGLIVQVTAPERLFAAFSLLGIPSLFRSVIRMTFRYLYILAGVTGQMYLAMKLKWLHYSSGESNRKLLAGRMVFLLRKSNQYYGQTFQAMLARGYSGKMNSREPWNWKKADSWFLVLLGGIWMVVLGVSYGL